MKSTRLAIALLLGAVSAGAVTASATAQGQAPTALSAVEASASRDNGPPPVSPPQLFSNMLLPQDPPRGPPQPAANTAALAGLLKGMTAPFEVLELAATYRNTIETLAETSSSFRSGEDVRGLVNRTAAYEPEQLQQGAVAYAALIAMRQPDFVAAVKQHVADPRYGDTLAEFMDINPASLDVAHIDKAAGLIIDALDRGAAAVAVKGYIVKQAAYDTQLSKWSLVRISDNANRLQAAKAISSTRLAGKSEDMAQLRRIAAGEEPDVSAAAEPAAGPYSPTVTQGLALAALMIAGKAGPENAALVRKLLTVSDTSFCLQQAKTTLYGCYSVAGPHFEDIFCSGQHSLIDPGMCIIKAAGATRTAFVEPTPRPARLIEGDEPAIIAKKAPAKAAPKKVARK